MKDIAKVFGVVVLVLILGWAAVMQGARQREVINDWASANQYKVISIDRCYFDHGPFWFVDDDKDVVYKVRVEDRLENQRTSYFLFRPFWHEQKWAN